MNFERNLEQIDLFSITKNDIETFKDVSLLVYIIRNEIDSTRDLDFIHRYYDIMLFLIKKFPIDQKHYSYFTQKSNINIRSEFPEEDVLNQYNKTIQGILEREYSSFNVELFMRPLETVFGYEDNLQKSKFSSKYIDKETFQLLINKLWYFVDYAKEQQLAEPLLSHN